MDGLLQKGKEFASSGKITGEDVQDAYKQFSKGGDFQTNAKAAYSEYQENHKNDKKESGSVSTNSESAKSTSESK
ncbi:hypothetical protein KGF56_000768 [Candida oxycetoniae]|uniref:Uncharacterized protein n=1 Tax=Candida oxycetoniae TaxID=497107 RepID=A0AAI9T007_9ASCO|nr:uncharacterized protein KGF56_000768 [Candida oxycetoniae]KAI3406288.1 hypothetical protein KGF56_000768 [Candida oxycetoniae]